MAFEVDPAARRLARLYALVHRGNAGDVDFYVRACAGAARVLELGCGTGRVLRAVAEVAGHVTGLDLEPAMLAEAEDALTPALAARVTLVQGDMRGFALAGRFDRIIIPYNGLYTLPSDDDMLACLRAAREHAAPGGALVFDAYVLSGDTAAQQPEPDEPWLHTVTAIDGRDAVEVWDREEPVSAPRTFDMAFKYVPTSGSGRAAPVVHTIRHHFLLAEQVAPLLARAGWRMASRWAGFCEEAFDARAEHMVVVAEPAID